MIIKPIEIIKPIKIIPLDISQYIIHEVIGNSYINTNGEWTIVPAPVCSECGSPIATNGNCSSCGVKYDH
jgi:hypothetical protein